MVSPVSSFTDPIHHVLHDFQDALNTLHFWEQEIPEEAGRKIAKERITIVLSHRCQNLDLENLGLTTLPDIFQCHAFNQLRFLHLTGNHLKCLPESICELPKLEILELTENHLENLPVNFGKLQSLLSLDVMENLLRTLPANFGELQALTELSLDSNELESLPENFCALQELKKLSLKFNKLKRLPENFFLLKNLQVLSLSFNPVETLPKDFCQLPLKRLGLTAVELRGSEINETIGQLPDLEFLSLTLSREKPLPENIFHLQKLEDVNLYNLLNTTDIPPDTIQDILRLPQTCSIALREENGEPWDALVQSLLQLVDQPDYTGPKFYF